MNRNGGFVGRNWPEVPELLRERKDEDRVGANFSGQQFSVALSSPTFLPSFSSTIINVCQKTKLSSQLACGLRRLSLLSFDKTYSHTINTLFQFVVSFGVLALQFFYLQYSLLLSWHSSFRRFPPNRAEYK